MFGSAPAQADSPSGLAVISVSRLIVEHTLAKFELPGLRPLKRGYVAPWRRSHLKKQIHDYRARTNSNDRAYDTIAQRSVDTERYHM